MRIPVTLLAAFLAVLAAGPAAVGAAGRLATLRYRGGAAGPVVFDHQLHAAKGFRCDDCHTHFPLTGKALFFTRKQGLITFADHHTSGKCFACHDGKGVFDDCAQCHRKTGGS
jgi:c(7)-type cytochrome triheme protein